MPTLSASTSAVFTATGLDATSIYETFTGLIGTAVGFGLWLVQVMWPYMLVLGFIYLMFRLAMRFTSLGR